MELHRLEADARAAFRARVNLIVFLLISAILIAVAFVLVKLG